LESPIYTRKFVEMSQATFEDILTEAVAYATDGLVDEFKKLNCTLEKILRELQRLNEKLGVENEEC